MTAVVSRRASPLDRLLRLFTDVRAGESTTVLLLAFNLFVVLTAYNVLRVLREPLILAVGERGAELRSYAAAGQVLVLSAVVPLYGVLAARLARRRLITAVTLFFAGCLVAFAGLVQLGVRVGVGFYVWVGVFNLMVIAQCWAFANDVYTTGEGKRLFPIVGFGASAGALLGSWLPDPLYRALGESVLMLLAAGLLVGSIALVAVLDARERGRTEAAVPDANTSGVLPAATTQLRSETGEFRVPDAKFLKASGQFRPVTPAQRAGEEETPAGSGGAFRLVFANRYLLLIALLLLVLNWVNTNGGYILSKTVSAAAEAASGGVGRDDFITAFYSRFYSSVNLLTLLLQMFAVSRVIKYLGVRVAILVLPVVAAIGYGIIAFVPLVGMIRLAKTAENSLDYSLQNTVRNVLFLPTTREQKYAAKQAIDTFFVRAGDLLTAALVAVGVGLLGLAARQFALVNLALVGIWLALAVAVGRRYEAMAAAAANP